MNNGQAIATPSNQRENTWNYTHGFVGLDDGLAAKLDTFDLLQYTVSFDPKNWNYRKEAIKIAKAGFGTVFSKWIEAQFDSSSTMYGRRLEFLFDTLDYITTGKRKFSVENWYELLEDEPQYNKSLVTYINKNKALNYQCVKQTTASVIAQWCSHPRGFEDLVGCLHILFGAPRTTDKPFMKGV